MNRRRALKVLGTSLGVLAAGGLYGRHKLIPPARSRELDSVDSLAARLYEGLSPELRAAACVDYDHPQRQHHNNGRGAGGLKIWRSGLDREQRGILTDLLHAGLSEIGRTRVPNQHFVNWPGVHLLNVLICGNPGAGPWQILLTGPHLNLRLGGRNEEGTAFGGPMVYGDQRGNERQGLPKNLYRFQFQTAHRLFRSLTGEQRDSTVFAKKPPQTMIQVQGSEGVFPGVALGGLSRESRGIARELMDGILSTYPADDVQYAWECLDENGGLDALHVSWYEEGDAFGSGELQMFRLEGPGAVTFFHGYPHVHAFVNIERNADEPMSVGEVLGENPRVLEGEGVRQLYKAAMREQTGADCVHYDIGAVAGRLRRGTIRTGDIYSLEAWEDQVALVEVKGANLSPAIVEELRDLGSDPDPARAYTIATTGYVALNETPKLGTIESRVAAGLVRDVTIDYLKEHGFPSSK